MKTIKKILLFLAALLCLEAISQNKLEGEARDQAIEQVADVYFETAGKQAREKLSEFENASGITLQFRVQNSSLDQIGGLSEYLFKMYQTFVGAEKPNTRTITGEFGVLKNDSSLLGGLSYETLTTADLARCHIKPEAADSLDRIYNRFLNSREAVDRDLINNEPISVTDILTSSCEDYRNIINSHNMCPPLNPGNVFVFDEMVTDSREARKQMWSNDIKKLSDTLLYNASLLLDAPTTSNIGSTQIQSTFNTYTSSIQKLGSYVIDLARVFSPCAAGDITIKNKLLYDHTRITFLFLTCRLHYAIPLDSGLIFRDSVVAATARKFADKNLIIALWLNQEASPTRMSPKLLVYQNGNWLTKAELNLAQLDPKGNYFERAIPTYKHLIKNIPKPLIVCYQTATVNGLLTTTYIRHMQPVKGCDQIYNHIFRIDKAIPSLILLKKELEIAKSESMEDGKPVPGKASECSRLRSQIRTTYLGSLQQPNFGECIFHIKEPYLADSALVLKATLTFLKTNFKDFFDSDQIKSSMNESIHLPSDLQAGTCPKAEKADLILSGLSFMSLILSPFQLDIVPDALTVVYLGVKGEWGEACVAAVAATAPMIAYGALRAVRTAGELVLATEKGGQLIRNGDLIKVADNSVEQVSAAVGINPAKAGPNYRTLVYNNQFKLQDLSNRGHKKLHSNLEQLEESKRIEFVQKCIDDPAFKAKVIADPDEVLRWGGIIRKLNLIPSSGASLCGDVHRTTTILGRWNPDMQIIKDQMLTKEFNVGTEFGTTFSNNGGFNFLNIPDELASSSQDFFIQYNKPWLEKAIQRRDAVILATKPVNKSDYIDPVTGNLLGMYAKELEYLVQRNYKPLSLSVTEWEVVKSWFQ